MLSKKKKIETLQGNISMVYIKNGGEGGIRTLGTVARALDFESSPFDHSGTSPKNHGAKIRFYLKEEDFKLSLIKNIISVNKSTFIGFFYDTNAALWSNISLVLHKKQTWLYITDEQTVQNIRAELKPFLTKGDCLPSKELGFREPVFRYTPTIQAITSVQAFRLDQSLYFL
jgi:hypothetical protein